MPTFLVLRCFSCEAFCVQQAVKTKKWRCKICGEKQSQRKVYARSEAAKECRKVCQEYNRLRGEREEERRASRELEMRENVDPYRSEAGVQSGFYDGNGVQEEDNLIGHGDDVEDDVWAAFDDEPSVSERELGDDGAKRHEISSNNDAAFRPANSFGAVAGQISRKYSPEKRSTRPRIVGRPKEQRWQAKRKRREEERFESRQSSIEKTRGRESVGAMHEPVAKRLETYSSFTRQYGDHDEGEIDDAWAEFDEET
eukprot:g1492.t1